MIKCDKMHDSMTIYLCTDLIVYFIQNILPKIKNTFVLVTGDSDIMVSEDIPVLTNNIYLLKWFAQNTKVQNHPKIVQLPIGLDYHTIYNNPNHPWKSENENSFPIRQEAVLLGIRNGMKGFIDREKKIYVNFSISNDRFGDRELSLKSINPKILSINNKFIKRTKNWENMINYAFVLSPAGVGLDCHRTWEALCLGCIPIIKKSYCFDKMFEDLPVLIVNNWDDITEQLLQNTINEFKGKIFNYDKLSLNYWKRLININK